MTKNEFLQIAAEERALDPEELWDLLEQMIDDREYITFSTDAEDQELPVREALVYMRDNLRPYWGTHFTEES
jgi:hypothetical protein